MRKYLILWEESENTINFEPMTKDKGETAFKISKKDITTFVLDFGTKTVTTTLDGCIEYISEKLEKEDFIALCSSLYFWGQYNGARL